MNKQIKLIKAVLLPGLTALILFTACNKKAGSGGEGALYRDEITIAITAQPPTLDSAITVSQVALDVASNIFEPLLALDAEYAPQPMLAKSVEIAPDGLTYTFPLREGVFFHNGKELKAADVTASMNRWLKISSRAKSLLPGAVFTSLDDYTVSLTVTAPSSDVLIILATWAQFPSIMPQEIIESAPPEGVTEYIGTGPYRFVEWKQDQSIELSRYDGYQSRNEPASGFTGRKDAPTARIRYLIVTDPSTRVAGVKTGEYDIAASIPTESYDELSAETNVTLYAVPSGVLTAFFNTRQGLLADVRMRQAILAAFNDDEIALAAFANRDLYVLSPEYLNPEQTQWKTDAGAAYYNQKNPEKAKRLLAEAGYDGRKLTILATPDYAEMYAASQVILEQLRQIGLQAEMVSYDFPTWLKTKNDLSTWDIFVASTGYQLTPPQILAVNPDWAGLDNPRVAESLNAIRAAPGLEQAKAEWGRLQGFLYEYGIGTPVCHYQSVVAANTAVEGYTFFFMCNIMWNARIPR